MACRGKTFLASVMLLHMPPHVMHTSLAGQLSSPGRDFYYANGTRVTVSGLLGTRAHARAQESPKAVEGGSWWPLSDSPRLLIGQGRSCQGLILLGLGRGRWSCLIRLDPVSKKGKILKGKVWFNYPVLAPRPWKSIWRSDSRMRSMLNNFQSSHLSQQLENWGNGPTCLLVK